TLVPVETPIDIKSQEIFDLEGYDEYSNGEDKDEHYHDATNGMINLKDITEELVIIGKPMRVFSNESDQMLSEGNGWEVIDEEEAVELAKDKEESESKQIDPRLQKLQQLYDEE
ncbi:MAG: DUF177 domain-containing protein, partial [Staphylococcus equorum]|nr:DUF177 domain-containing protein [Staphylococcus equorum]